MLCAVIVEAVKMGFAERNVGRTGRVLSALVLFVTFGVSVFRES